MRESAEVVTIAERATLVLRLFFVRSPTTVARKVAEVVVDAVKAVTRRRFWTHVGKEVLERLSPARIDRDASAAVVLVSGVRRITALKHVQPRMVFDGAGASVGCGDFAGSLAAQTAAAPVSAIAEVGDECDGLVPAITPTEPPSLDPFVWGLGDYNKASITKAGQVQGFHYLQYIT